METWIVALGLALVSGGLGALVVFDRVARPLRARLRVAEARARASRDSQEDVVVLWTQDRERLKGDLRRMEERAIDALVGEDVARAQVTMLRGMLDRAVKEREEARAASRLALTFYGAEVSRADAAEDRLERLSLWLDARDLVQR